MKSELLKKIADRYRREYESYGEVAGASSFRDVKNLISEMKYISRHYSNFKKGDEVFNYVRMFRIYRIALRDYFDLLDAYPDYREAELYGNQEGEKIIVGFPDLLAYCRSREGMLEQEKIFGDNHPHVKEHYVMLSKKRLEDV
jgi:hypothetical protein